MRRLATVRLTSAMREVPTTQLEEFLPGVRLFAVRSSADGEDGARRSFAGLYDTVLDVPETGLEQAIIAVWRSWFSARAVIHRETEDWQASTMAVVVQRMINAKQAGVAAVFRPRGTRRRPAVPVGLYLTHAHREPGDARCRGGRSPIAACVAAAQRATHHLPLAPRLGVHPAAGARTDRDASKPSTPQLTNRKLA